MSLCRTPFFRFHVEAGARIVPFAGFEMPLQYEGIVAEHRRVRSAVGLLDVSHMGEIRLRGPDALAAVRHLVTNDVAVGPGRAQYTPMCRPDGGIVDDLIVYVLADDDVLMCVNAANREKDVAWVRAHLPAGVRVEVRDEGDDWAQVAVQGPRAEAVLSRLVDVDLSAVPPFGVVRGRLAGIAGCILARTGYTGEDGFEVFLPAGAAAVAWPAILEAGRDDGIGPVGLGARDTLRLEARMCLYGNDIDETTTPLEAGLGWTVKLDKPDFVGREALLRQKEEGVRRRLVGLVVEGRIARAGHAVLHGGEPVGRVTSGTRAPWLGKNIALAYVPRHLARPGTELEVDVRGRRAPARVVRGPFYRRER